MDISKKDLDCELEQGRFFLLDLSVEFENSICNIEFEKIHGWQLRISKKTDIKRSNSKYIKVLYIKYLHMYDKKTKKIRRYKAYDTEVRYIDVNVICCIYKFIFDKEYEQVVETVEPLFGHDLLSNSSINYDKKALEELLKNYSP